MRTSWTPLKIFGTAAQRNQRDILVMSLVVAGNLLVILSLVLADDSHDGTVRERTNFLDGAIGEVICEEVAHSTDVVTRWRLQDQTFASIVVPTLVLRKKKQTMSFRVTSFWPSKGKGSLATSVSNPKTFFFQKTFVLKVRKGRVQQKHRKLRICLEESRWVKFSGSAGGESDHA